MGGTSIQPPNQPWLKLSRRSNCGYLSYYYSDDLSGLAVRGVTKLGDNKSDPNFETGTYGLFSTCGRSMRSGVVKKGMSSIFFVTSKKGQRVLSGYYHVGWYAIHRLDTSDFQLAADGWHFIDPPLPLKDIDKQIGTHLNIRFRSTKLLSEEECDSLKRLLDKYPNKTREYIEEIDRLERFNLKHGGYRYVAWKQSDKFSWKLAEQYVQKAGTSKSGIVLKNSTFGDLWKCRFCQHQIKNKALLRICPECKRIGGLMPIASSGAAKH